MNYETLSINENNGVAHIELNRPEKANAFNEAMWKDLKSAFEWLSTSNARVGVLSAQGKHFTAGLDLDLLMNIQSDISKLPKIQKQEALKKTIIDLQAVINAVESCRKPVIAAIHGACIGAGVDLITACDMRYATENARFSVKEVDMAIVADLGTLQRLPRLIGEGLTRELAYTGREFDGKDAFAMRLVNRIFQDKESLMNFTLDLANDIARKSPLTIRGIKSTLNFSHDHTVAEGLSYVASMNSEILFSDDLAEAVSANRQKRIATFKD